jgi:hypothetical protein
MLLNSKLLMTAAVFAIAMAANSAYANDDAPTGDPDSGPTEIDRETTDYEAHGGLPGGGNAGGESGRGWSYDGQEPEYDGDWANTGGWVDNGDGTETWTETRTGTQEMVAVNPGGISPGTNRFNATDTVTETQSWTRDIEEEGGPPDNVNPGVPDNVNPGPPVNPGQGRGRP